MAEINGETPYAVALALLERFACAEKWSKCLGKDPQGNPRRLRRMFRRGAGAGHSLHPTTNSN
jgi:hypothetical protein